MNRTRTRTTETAHGTVEYETVACANCSAAVLVDDAVPVVLGGGITDWYRSTATMRLEGEHMRTTNLCPYCSSAIFEYEPTPGMVIDLDDGPLDRLGLGRITVPDVSENPAEFVIFTLGIAVLVTAFVFVLVSVVLTAIGGV